nr:helix-turn-helix domain-containing protein [Chryseobacterium sp. pc1-10]
MIEGRLSGYDTAQIIKLAGIYLSGIIYFSLGLVKLIRFKKKQKEVFSNIEQINFNWLLYQIIFLCLVWIIILFVKDDKFIFGSGAVFILWLGYFGISQVNVFSKQDIRLESYNDFSEISNEHFEPVEENDMGPASARLAKIYQHLLIILEEEKPYLNAELKLLDLARLLQIHTNVLSKAINATSKKNFYELINEKRVEEFIRKIKNGDHQKYTIITLAYDSGFNSKASFNRNFKRITGMSPTEFMVHKEFK